MGALHLLPKHVQQAAARAMQMTASHHNFILNICFPYTGSDEIKRAGQLAGQYPGSFEYEDFRGFLDTWDSPPLDIMVRTSGEARLSEFLLWQVCDRQVHVEILDCLWPEFGFGELLRVIIRYQRRRVKALESCEISKELHDWRVKQKELLIQSLQTHE